MKKAITALALVFALAGCGGPETAVNAPVEDIGTPSSAGGAPTSPEIPFTGDACEYAKLAFIQAYQAYQKHLTDRVLRDRQQQARLAVKAVCESEKDDDEGKTWACAEGHSCR